MVKAIQDFILYSVNNLTWFALNFVLFMMPVVCVYWLNPLSSNLDAKGATGSYSYLMVVVCLANLI